MKPEWQTLRFHGSGLLHALLGIRSPLDLDRHPMLGASWEGFAMTQLLARLGPSPDECFFWATHQGAELDLLVVRGRRRLGFEFKRSEAPTATKSMRIAVEDLRLDSLDVIHPGPRTYAMGRRLRAIAFDALLAEFGPLR